MKEIKEINTLNVLCSGIESFDTDSFLENDYIQSVLGHSGPYEDIEILNNAKIDSEIIETFDIQNSHEANNPSVYKSDLIDSSAFYNMDPKVNFPNSPNSDTFMIIDDNSPPIQSFIENHETLNEMSEEKLSPEETFLTVAEALEESENINLIERQIDKENDLDSRSITIEPRFFNKSENTLDLYHLQLFQRRYKDSWVLKYIEEDIRFKWPNQGVQEWLQFRHKDQELLLGKLFNDLLILNPNQDPLQPPEKISVGLPITALETCTLWNFDLNQEEGVIILASGNKVLWYRNRPVTQKFELFGKWDLGGHITRLQYFRKFHEDRLLVGFNNTFIQIFKFHLDHQKYWMLQELYMEMGFEEFQIIELEGFTWMALSHENVISLYLNNWQNGNEFYLQKSLVAVGVSSLTKFSVNGEFYLINTGYEGKILKFIGNEFQEVSLFSSKFGKVEYVLPVPLKGQQDDLLLIMEISNNSQKSIQSLMWNGITFESMFSIPCHRKHSKSKIPSNLNCLFEFPLESLKGSNLFTHKNEIFLILPQDSYVFHLHFELLLENSELLDILEYFMILNKWFEQQHQIIDQAKEFLNTPNEILIENVLKEKISKLDYVATPELEFSGYVSEIYLNDHLWSKEDSEINLDSLINLIEDLDKNIDNERKRRDIEDFRGNLNPLNKKREEKEISYVRDENSPLHYDQLIYDEISVEDLEIVRMNGEEFFINSNGILNFPGEIEMEELEILEELNNERQMKELKNIIWENDLEFDFINNIKWKDFRDNIILRNEPQILEDLEVEGNIIVEDSLFIKSLNTLNFPQDYLLANGPRSSIVKSEKYFVNTLKANSVDTEGFINNQNPLEAITLMGKQEWQGSPVFNHLEVSEKLELQGQAHGRNVNGSPINPTLRESKTIKASCVFNDLHINGPIVLKGDLNEKPLEEILNNIIQRPENPMEEIQINSSKIFNEITFPLDFKVENGKINNIPIDNFLTVHTPQTLNITALEGYVYFYNLTLKGLYDNIDIEDIRKDLITLDRPLDLGSMDIIFENHPLETKSLIVLKDLNGIDIKTNMQTLKEDLILDYSEFEDLQGDISEVGGDILGPGKLNNIELEAFVNDRSWHEPPIQGNLFIKELIAPQGIETDELHGINSEDLLDFLDKIEELPEMVLNGQIQVDQITVMGDVQIHKVNGLMFDEDIQMTSIWLNRPNHLVTNLTFLQPVEVRGDLKISGNYQGENFPNLLKDFVRKDPSSPKINIKTPKSFLNQVRILNNSQISALNGQSLENLALRSKTNIFQGSVKIKGNLITNEIENPHLDMKLNLKDIKNLLYFDSELYSFVLKGNIAFKDSQNLEDLTVEGNFNDLLNMKDFFTSLVYKNHSPDQLKGNYTFTGRVTIEKGLNVHNLNNIHINELLKNLIYIHGPHTNIMDTKIQFQDLVNIKKLTILKSLKTSEINKCSLEEWLNDTLRVDQDQNIPHYLHFSRSSLDGNSLKVRYLNDIDLNKIITLNTPQTFEGSVEFSDLILNGLIQINGSVNKLNLEKEYNNTLMIYGGQNISTPLTIQSIDVLKDLQINCLVNKHKNLSDVATLQGNLDLKSPVYFQSLYSPQFIIKDLITGIDIEKWFETSVRLEGRPLQKISGNWSTNLLDVKMGSQDFAYDSWDYNSFIRNVRSFAKDQKKICEILEKIWGKLKKKSLKIKYLEEDFGLNSLPINATAKWMKMFALTSDKNVLLMVNLDCLSYLYKWNLKKQRFHILGSYESGYLDQVLMVPSQELDTFKFVTNYESTTPMNCSLKGFNLWSYEKNITNHERTFEEEVSDLYGMNFNGSSSLFILSKNKVKELNLLSFEIHEKWVVSSLENETSYRFLNPKDSEDIGITNGEHLIYLNGGRSNETFKDFDGKPFSSPLEPWMSAIITHPDLPTSLLKPNSTLAREFVFSDFQQTLQRLILDTIKKLDHQITITQLTIPESDLYDEHLLPDFLAALLKLQQQKIFTKNEMNINFSQIKLPENPAHVLATRVVLIMWPRIEELQEIHGFLKDNETHKHPVCRNLTLTMGSLIQEVLLKAYPENPEDLNENLFNVIQTINKFQEKFKELEKSLENFEENSKNIKLLNQEMLTLNSTKNPKFITLKPQNLREPRKSEILSLTVGSIKNPHRLWATTKPNFIVNPGFDSAIQINSEDYEEKLFQIISANGPHSLIQIRLGAETLLGFIEDCCNVQLWRYQGVQGFVKFGSFHSDTHIHQIVPIRVPAETNGSKQLLALLLKDGFKFYEIVIKSNLFDPPNLSCP